MKTRTGAVVLASACAGASATNPVSKVVQMLSELEAKIIKEGSSAQKVYAEYTEWCEERSRTLGNEIKTGNDEVASLKAAIAKENADTGALTAKIEDLSAELAKDEADLKAASTIRGKEATVFAATEKDLVDTVDTLERAIRIIESEMNKGGASMLQLKNAGNLVQALKAMVDASAISSADASKLNAFIQGSDGDASSEDDAGAPAGSVYDSHSGNILETLNSLLEKGESQLEEARNVETSNQHNFDMMRQGLEDEVSYGNKELAEAKKGLAGSQGGKATAEGDLDVTSKELSADVKAKADLHHECMTTAENFEAETKSRGEELKALAEAKKVIVESTSGATSISYSFLQATSEIASSASLANFEAVRLVSDLARKEKSAALTQLAQRMRLAMHSTDAFGKVKGLIRDMISKLEDEAEADASKKAWCDRNLADANQRKAEKTAEIEKITTRVDAMSAKSAQLKEEIAELQAGLAKLAASQVEMDKIRGEEHEAYVSNKADMEQGLEGVKLALKILGEYYASEDKDHSAAMGAGEGIIGLLEVVESDFSKNLAEINATEESAVAAYEQQTKENEIEKTTKDQDVRYKQKESTHLDKSSAELVADRSTVEAELDATNKLLSQLDAQCIDKAETYAEQKAKREAELAGLKEALQILETETALVQKKSLRATRRHA